MGYHKSETGSSLHTPFRWIFNDETEREAQSVGSVDVNKIAWQKGDNTLWVLKDDSPKTWTQISPPLDAINATSVTAETIEATTSLTAANVLSSITRESGSTNWGMYLGSVMLNDDEAINITTAFDNVPAGHVVMGFIKICSDISGGYILGEIAYMVGEYLSVVTDASNSLATSDTDGKVCFYVSGATLMLKNRMGVAVGFKLAGFITVA